MKYTYALALIFVLLLLISCDVEDCISTKTNDMIIEFYRSGRTKDVDYPVNVLQARMDSMVILQDDDSLRRDTVQFNPVANHVRFEYDLALYDLDTVITGDEEDDFIVRRRYTDTIMAVLDISYQRNQRVITPECGVEQSYNSISITHEGFDSIRVVNKNLDIFNEVSVKLYL